MMRAIRATPLYVLLLLTPVVVLLAGCSSGDGSMENSASPTASGPLDLSPNVGGVQAALDYLRQTGIDGHKGDFTDPVNCDQVNDDTKGDFCIHPGPSVYAPGLVLLVVAEKDSKDTNVWKMRLERGPADWHVVKVEPFSAAP